MNTKFPFSSLIKSFSKLISEEATSGKKETPQQKSHRQEIENSVLVLTAAVIRCDKNLTGDTEKYIHAFLTKQFGATGFNRQLKTVANHIETGTEPFTKIACKELKLLTTHDSRISILRFLFGVAAADDFVNAKETRCIHRIAGYLGVTDKDFKELKYHFLSKNNPFVLLGVEEDASLEQIKTAYRKMVLKFHPDKRDKNTTEEEAAQKFRELKRAFEVLKDLYEKR